MKKYFTFSNINFFNHIKIIYSLGFIVLEEKNKKKFWIINWSVLNILLGIFMWNEKFSEFVTLTLWLMILTLIMFFYYLGSKVGGGRGKEILI